MNLKTFFILLFLSSGICLYSQELKVNFKDTPLKTILKEITQQSGYNFVYRDALLDNEKNVSITHQGKVENINQLLDKLFAGTNITYSVKGNQIALSFKENKERNTANQNLYTITGVVSGKDGKPLPGVNILVKGTTNGVISDLDGRYTLRIRESDKTLVISCIGMKTQEVEINNRGVINIPMEDESLVIDQIVVVGYGTTTRKDLTGSVASVDITEVKNAPVMTIDAAIAGKAAGVQVIKADGSPGGGVKMRIRGGTSLIGGNDPLYIIDGVQVTPQNKYIQGAAEIVNPVESIGDDDQGAISGAFARGLNNLSGLNINDIESIDILKDASATAIYGSKAANGVVIITTKKGKFNQKPTLEVNYYAGSSQPINAKLLNAEQYKSILKEAAQNFNDVRASKGQSPDAVATQILTNPDYFGTGNTDWLDLVTRNGFTQNADISMRGGGTGSRYYASLSYSGQKGVLLGTDFTRISGKINLDNEITDRLNFIINLDYGFSENNITNGIYSQALFAPPTYEPYNSDGSPKVFTSLSFTPSSYRSYNQNPLSMLQGINQAKTNSLIGSIALEYDILKTLKFRSVASVNNNSYHQRNYTPASVSVAYEGGATDSDGGVGSRAQSEQVDLFFENTITWNEQFNENNRINLLLGTTWQESHSTAFSASGQGYPDDQFLNDLSSAALALPPTASSDRNSLLSFYIRANYALKERYLLTFTGRSDASSKFPKANRVGYFPSFGIAWRITEEGFMQNIKWIDELKLRASAGYTGTQNIGDNMFYTLYTPSSYARLNSLIPSQLGNDAIKWETTIQKDLGLDFSMFNSRLRGTFGLYQKNTSDLLMAIAVPQSSGFVSVIDNIANIENKGIELDIRGDFIKTKNFLWSGAFNISRNKSKVTNINRDMQDPTQISSYDDPFYNSLYLGNSIIREGEPIGLLYGFNYLGLIKTQEELDAYKAKSLYAQYGLLTYLGIGDAMYDCLEEGDYKGMFKPQVIGSAEPKFFGGYTNTFNYKNFSLITLFTFSYGNQIYYLKDINDMSVTDLSNKGVAILDHYSATNADSGRPRILLKQSAAYGTSPSSRGVYDASYIKLKSATLAWQAPKSFTGKLNIRDASVYISATNLFTITKYPGADPEVSSNPYGMIQGYTDSGSYPTIKQYSIGVRLEF